ncbi:MAG: acyl-CoA reductase [Cyclobacteriaceae bacterium]|nr:acyl-CoA reductase [Flammeovirgaceae bacterium]MDG1105625.1 acyl-CoA reductase [Cyclobacteriaceae bacterium]
MKLEERLNTFIKLNQVLIELSAIERAEIIKQAANNNRWFNTSSVEQALSGLIHLTDPVKMKTWLTGYDLKPSKQKIIGLIMAGNIPLVGFHDLICVLLSGHKAAIKLSSQDLFLMQWMIRKLCEIEPAFIDQIDVCEQLKVMDAVIATGSNNTARYFDYYFGKYPHIIRKNRTSVAILNGKETDTELMKLGKDVFTYFGLGCRNVSKIWVPQDYHFLNLLDLWVSFKKVADNFKYHNNYEYNKSIYLVNGVNYLDTGFLLLTESEALTSPISVLYYQQYQNLTEVDQYLTQNQDKIQCMVSSQSSRNFIPFGQTQVPDISDYADGIDVMRFLSTL